MNVNAVIFDLDGTLLNTIDDIADAVNATLRAFDFPEHPVDAYKYYVGNGMRTLVQRVLPDTVDEALHHPFLLSMQEQYKLHWSNKTVVYPAVPLLLDYLNNEKIPIAVLSNKAHEFVLLMAARFLKKWKFSGIYGARSSVPKKPDPAASMQIAAQFRTAPEDILFVGDTNTDMKTAVSAGMVAVGAAWGFRTAAELEEAGARYIIETPQELIPIIEGMKSNTAT
jgi:phosphoglycolate phosphatase